MDVVYSPPLTSLRELASYKVRYPSWLAYITFTALIFLTTAPAFSKDVSLRVLVIATGTPAEDEALNLISGTLTNIGVHYDVLNTRLDTLTEERLFSGTHGNFNGIILTDSQLVFFIPGVGYQPGLTLAEWQILHNYEQSFGVREVVLGGWPALDASLDLDYGLQYVSSVDRTNPVNARWVPPAGGTEIFEYVNPDNALVVNDWSYVTAASGSATGPTVQPLLAIDGDTNRILVAELRYANGREVLFSSITNATFLIHSKVLAYEFLNYATKGVFIGAREVALATHIDDVFLSTELWDPVSNTTPAEGVAVRMDENDIGSVITAQDALHTQHPTTADFQLDIVFNAMGSTAGDPLTSAIQANQTDFRYINHTYSHLDMETAVYSDALFEINENLAIWNTLGFPNLIESGVSLVTGKHSGLHTVSLSFPAGMNPALFDAARDANISYIAMDSSQPNENIVQYAPGYSIVMLPRRPSALFYNVAAPAEWVDEYNYIFRERFIEAGQDPCTIPGAVCNQRNYDEILQAESELALRQLLEFRLWPYYMHQANLKNYDGTGKTLLFDWLEAVVSRYEVNMRLPLKSYQFYSIGDYSRDRLDASTATITANWDLDTNLVTFNSTNQTSSIWVTGISEGIPYGGQQQRFITLDENQTYTFSIDRALAQ